MRCVISNGRHVHLPAESGEPKGLRRLLHRHRWSCVGKSGYWRCDGSHYCTTCGYAPKGTRVTPPDVTKDGPQ